MKKEEILRYLCYYDLRNPIGIIDDLTIEEIKEEGYGEYLKKDCACDNCFYGRIKLSEEIFNKLKV